MNQDAIDILENFEGNKLTAYPDSSWIFTIGRGHTDGVKQGMTITQAQSDAFFLADRNAAFLAAKAIVSPSANLNQLSAAAVFAYNVKGWSATPLFKLLSEGDFETAKSHWLLYDHVTIQGVKVEVPGLLNRRQAELALFCKSVVG